MWGNAAYINFSRRAKELSTPFQNSYAIAPKSEKTHKRGSAKGQQATLTTKQKAKKRKGQLKRKRNNLKVSTGNGDVDKSIFVPETPRRTLHTQLLIKLMSTAGDRDSDGKSMEVRKDIKEHGLESFAETIFSTDMDRDVQPFESLDIDFTEVWLNVSLLSKLILKNKRWLIF